AMSETDAPTSIASAASATSSVTSGPIMCTPSSLSVFASPTTLTQPSVSFNDIARPDAPNGKRPSTGSTPAALPPAPSTLSVFASPTPLTQPSVSFNDIARPDAPNGKRPSTGSKPAAFASADDM